MRVSERLRCRDLSRTDVRHECQVIPDFALNLPPGLPGADLRGCANQPVDNYYAPGGPLFAQGTAQAFQEGAANAASGRDITYPGVYLSE